MHEKVLCIVSHNQSRETGGFDKFEAGVEYDPSEYPYPLEGPNFAVPTISEKKPPGPGDDIEENPLQSPFTKGGGDTKRTKKGKGVK